MATKHEFELGDRVIYTHYLKRQNGTWEPIELKEPVTGWIVGARTKQNIVNNRVGTFKAFLVATKLYRNGIPVLPIHITKLYTSTVVTHHFDPAQPNIDLLHTFGSNDNGATWSLMKTEEFERGDNAFWDEFPGVSAEEMQSAVLDMLVANAQDEGEYD